MEAVAAVGNYDGLTGSLTCQDESPQAGDCATGETLAILQLTADEVRDGNWPLRHCHLSPRRMSRHWANLPRENTDCVIFQGT